MRTSPQTGYKKRRHKPNTGRSESPIVLNAAGGDLKGEINLIWEPVNTADFYILQRCTSLKKPYKWKYEDIISSPKYTATNLKSKKQYLFSISVKCVSGKSLWSKPVQVKAP